MIAEDLSRAQSLDADFIIACVHWGDEYQHKENATQSQIADFLVQHGCDLIVGSHPHVVQPIKKIAGYAPTPDADFVVQPIKKIAGYAPIPNVDFVISPNEKAADYSTNSVLVAYSLGNFISNQQWRYSDGGIMLEVTLTKTDGRVTLDSYRYEPFWVHRYPEKGVQVYRLIPVLDYLTNPERYPIISIDDEKLLIQFYKDTKEIAGGK
jgi:poly-gamma-glutamate synthesis protein (capsule biosynthesis protein)